MRSVDTNALVRVLTRDDARQADIVERWIENGAWVSLLVLAETTWVLSAVYDRSREQIATALAMLLDHRELTLEAPEVIVAALASFQQRGAPGFSDCLMLEVARKAGHLPLGTFDRQFARLDGAERLK